MASNSNNSNSRVGGKQDSNANKTNQGKVGGTSDTAAKPQQGDSTKPEPGQGEAPKAPTVGQVNQGLRNNPQSSSDEADM